MERVDEPLLGVDLEVWVEAGSFARGAGPRRKRAPRLIPCRSADLWYRESFSQE